MYHKRTKRLVEVCPQCCKSLDSSANRLVQDACGHSKCRICLLLESSGCLLCIAEKRTSNLPIVPDPEGSRTSVCVQTTETPLVKSTEPQQRKSVITSLATQLAEQKQYEINKQTSPPLSPVDKETCHVIKQSLEKDILFPTDIVKRSTGNFYHLKRVFSQRFFNEDRNKEHKACETEEKWTIKSVDVENDKEEEISSEKASNWKIPSHIKVQYYCTVHKVSFQQKHNIMRHHMTCSLLGGPVESNADSSFPCKVCGKIYKLVGKLNRHMKVHTKITKYKCETCGKCFTDTYALKSHERTHTQLKPYVCQYCDKKFAGFPNFKRHERKHRDDKRFICDDCGYRYLTKLELKRHSATHTNSKPFACSVCGSKFAFKRTLVRHMTTHDSNPMRVECQYCDSTFKRKDNLERHMKNSHADLKPEDNEKSLSNPR